MRTVSRIYGALLYFYPRQFRLEYGSEMKRLFRERCGDVARTNDPLRMANFILRSAADWLTTGVREQAASVRAVASIARKRRRADL